MRYATTPRKPPVFVPDAIFQTLDKRQAADTVVAALVKAGIETVVVPIVSRGVETHQVAISADDWTKAETVVGKMYTLS